jgi:MFS transporter, Spinster family, sphingosine-1-phosphate transporter
VLIRCSLGVGEASYTVLAPTIIGDLFTGVLRTRILALFYIGIPIGGGLGYILSSNISLITGDWRWALRITPPFGLICILVLWFTMKEPKRGRAEGLRSSETNSTLQADLLYLFKKLDNNFFI